MIYKEPDNDVEYIVRWNSEQLKKDHFQENGTISYVLENWAFVAFRSDRGWIKRQSNTLRGRRPQFQILDTEYNNGNVTFIQVTNRPVIFKFDISLVVLLKETRHLKIWYTSTILYFLPRLFSYQSTTLEYCGLWLSESNEVVPSDSLQNCPCTLHSVRFDPDFLPDSTCSSSASKCYENIGAARCF